MIEFGATLLLIAASLAVYRIIDPIVLLVEKLASLLDDIGGHRQSQAASVMHHAGLLHIEGSEDDE